MDQTGCVELAKTHTQNQAQRDLAEETTGGGAVCDWAEKEVGRGVWDTSSRREREGGREGGRQTQSKEVVMPRGAVWLLREVVVVALVVLVALVVVLVVVAVAVMLVLCCGLSWA